MSSQITPVRRLARVSYGAGIGLALGTIVALAAPGTSELAPAIGAGVGAVLAVVIGRIRERRA